MRTCGARGRDKPDCGAYFPFRTPQARLSRMETPKAAAWPARKTTAVQAVVDIFTAGQTKQDCRRLADRRTGAQ